MEKTEICVNKKREDIKKEIKNVLKSMDFISDNFLNREDITEEECQVYFNIYQQLGYAWEFWSLQCDHMDGYEKIKGNKEACKICGKIKGIDELFYLLPTKGSKKIGSIARPNSRKTFKNKKESTILNDRINFHGAQINVDVHNAYKSKLFRDKETITIAAERIVELNESGVECHVDQYLIHIRLAGRKKKPAKQEYGGFPWEIRKKDLKNFPVIFEYDDDYNFLGLIIFR